MAYCQLNAGVKYKPFFQDVTFENADGETLVFLFQSRREHI